MIDIAVTGPATNCRVRDLHTDCIPGASAQRQYLDKVEKYRNAAHDEFTVVPFVIETGGYIHHVARKYLDDIAANGDNVTKIAVRHCYSVICRELTYSQTNMLVKYNEQHSRF